MKLFSVIYLKGKLVAAMVLWQGASMQHCQMINAKYEKTLPTSLLITSGKATMSDIRITCEWHMSEWVPLKIE
jgi:hypothetical protein